jgi:hypothetical protein
MATQDISTPKPRMQSAEMKIAFEARFPRLRLVNFVANPTNTSAELSIGGTGPDLIDIGLLAQSTIDSMPRCGVKTVSRWQGAGVYAVVFRTNYGFRVQTYIGEDDLFGVFSAIRGAVGFKVAEIEGGPAFSAMFPGLQVTKAPRLTAGGTLMVCIAGSRREDFLRAGLATHAMFDAQRGDGDVRCDDWFRQFPDENCDTLVQRYPAGQGYRFQVKFGHDSEELGQTVRNLFLKDSEPTSLELATRAIENCEYFFRNLPAAVADQLNSRVTEMLAVVNREICRPKMHRSGLRLVVDNTVRP